MSQKPELEKSIIRNINRGKKDSFKEIFDLHFHALLSFGGNYVSDRQVVEDIIQEVFVAFWEKRVHQSSETPGSQKKK